MNTLSLINSDPGLLPYEDKIRQRQERVLAKQQQLACNHSRLYDAMNGHLYYGLHCYSDKWVLREWAPNAVAVHLIGDFSGWKALPLFRFTKKEYGNWELVLPLDYLEHGSLYKLLVTWVDGQGERIPAYCRRVVQDETTKLFTAQVWNPERPYVWKHKNPERKTHPLVYEAHPGMATEEAHIATYNEFCEKVLPRIAKTGYDTIQLMGIQEHPYYGSFGYQVSSFFAPSSRFGTPEELKQLIDEAHRLKISVILDIVHSHAVKNDLEGLSHFDGTEYQYFHKGEKGIHRLWDSRCFDYGKDEVLHFLLSNCKYWLEEFHFDGFRFDGVTSMMYLNHGIGVDFLDYSMYYDGNQDEDAIQYLSLANILVHEHAPHTITIAEDVSGMPGLAVPQQEGGIGFDYRMAMGVSDFWMKTIEEKKDEEWHVGDMFFHLTDKRKEEHTISYAECHDQAMMGDNTIIFRLIGANMYTQMSTLSEDIVVDRGVALHKMIRLATLATAGDGYLNFMGNEFGHPEWIDFPREGNNWSFRYARRQWKLADNKSLRYYYLNLFDQAMIALARKEKIFDVLPFVVVQNNEDQVLVFTRGSCIFAFNFNPVQSFTNYGFAVEPGKYVEILDSDATEFDGFGRNIPGLQHFTRFENGAHLLKLYLPNRSVLVLKRKK
ncbi:MAG: alpha amylase C-terminal domain-containing protein [Lentimicrobiaceae bacterium]|nr:alpha amylase C-terminal domain-containing protein [Lentimicrobiaceae bacterium]